MIKIRHLLGAILILIAVIPTAIVSTLMLEQQSRNNEQATTNLLNRALQSTADDISFKFAVASSSFRSFSGDRFLSQALESFLFSSHAFRSMRDFVTQTPLVNSAYLLDPDLFVVESVGGSISGLEQSGLLVDIRAADKAGRIKEGRQLLFHFANPLMTQMGEQQEHLSDHGIAILSPVYLHSLQEGLTRQPDGYVLAVVPFNNIFAVVPPHLQEGERADVLHNNHSLQVTEKQNRDKNEQLLAHYNLIIGSTEADNTLTYLLEMQVNRAARTAHLQEAEATLRNSILASIAMAVIVATLLMRWLRAPFMQLSAALKSYSSGAFGVQTPSFRYQEFEDVRHLLAQMGQTISKQVESLRESNRELEKVGQLKDEYLSQLKEMNEKLETRVEEKTSELRATLEREERSRQILQRLLALSIELQQCEDNESAVNMTLSHMALQFPRTGIALLVMDHDHMQGGFATVLMEEQEQQWLQQSLQQYAGKTLAQLPRQLEFEQLHYLLFPLTESNQRYLGMLVFRTETISREDQDILRLFVKQFSGQIENRRLTNELEAMARTDGLTGLPNRAAFEEALTQAGDVHHRYPEQHIGLFVLDANGLKQANDKYGHEAGDVLLIAIAEALLGCSRRSDRVFRLGGDEYAILVQQGDEQACKNLEQRLNEVLNAPGQWVTIPDGHTNIPVSFAFGFASTDETAFNALFRTADERMYDNKQAHYRRIAGQHA